MGLLDMMNDPKQAGLMMAAAQMMAQSGPSARPVGIGEILGGGMGAYMNTKNAMTQQQADEEERKQMAEARKLEMQKAQMSLQESMRFNDFYKNRGAKMPAATQGMAPEQTTSLAPGAAAGQAPQHPSEYERLMQEANELQMAGFPRQAKDAYELAIKLRPEFDQTPRVANGPDGKPFSYVLDKGGNIKRLDGVLPREEMKMANLGGHEMAYNPFALQHGQTFNKSMTTGDRVSLRNADVTDNRAREFNAIQQDANNIQRGEKQRTDQMTRSSQVASFDTMLGTLDRLGDHEGLSRSVGAMSLLPTMPGSDSANFQAELETFQSQAFIPMVAQLKGMGALSDAEGRKLTAAVGALNPSMSKDAFKQSVARIKADMELARQRVTGSMTSAPSQRKPRRYNPATGRIE